MVSTSATIDRDRFTTWILFWLSISCWKGSQHSRCAAASDRTGTGRPTGAGTKSFQYLLLLLPTLESTP